MDPVQAEEWCRVPSVPALMVSSAGRIMVAPYLAPMPKGGVRSYGGFAGHGQWDGERLIYVHKGKTYKVHRLVCEAFHGPAPVLPPGETGRIVCMHLDENSRNNRASNLSWGTQKENLNAPGFLAYCATRTAANNPRVKGLAAKANGQYFFA
ncbi:HNH endonuclease signature motif containing protein [Piscinibacter gummiphilus]|uniref:HNH endonuclease signature motif containing protein n=1 Tax=Piscinibacter gummiphilus TaxID=946333 RepID=A0ABZ0CUJ1_9BURK|nr:HNH endonuclease signature motif containing protein [Piscinibacter gummiphilus]WOB06553.1 HNH endonuclease signature motif containing protein [Piscinibacter gummiphilus]